MYMNIYIPASTVGRPYEGYLNSDVDAGIYNIFRYISL